MRCAVCLLFLVSVVVTSKSFYPEVTITGESGLRLGLVDDDIWEYVDIDADAQTGDLVEYKTSVLYNSEWIDSEWTKVSLVPRGLMVPRKGRRSYTVFRDDFNSFDKSHYTIDVTAWGGGNGEFQVYTPEHNNLYASNGYLYMKPTLTVDHPSFDNGKLYNGRMDLNSMYHTCTNGANSGCSKSAYGHEILPPVMSGKITSHACLTYGRVNVRARIPKGDWLWPAIWLLSCHKHYGSWPRSGEIDIMESRGNLRAEEHGSNHGVSYVASTLHWGPDAAHNAYYLTHKGKHAPSGDWHGWHTYSLEWTDHHIITYVDNQEIMHITTPSQGFWNWAHFHGNNIWGSHHNAPFDHSFHLILNVAVGGGFFSDSAHYNTPKPWHRSSPHPKKDFWEKRGDWLPTWHGDDVAMLIDYVEMIQY
ncbi:beta-1,3-glucan-binding protein-like [Saccostrea echinata]|uniref:beta-1,3-glucan-binding protein-like n=1 Tax=Saccostrea echinata TaxID=191078 RepID=UPI002A8162A7|nr:beta-1,3-glucan-binding protein-like [Saccostrea echinata]XP_061177898.1 beta-1,3-glucan-binding protein-like [Saccostrea echinata]